MPRRSTTEFGLPPFVGAVRQIIIASTAIYVVILLLEAFAPSYAALITLVGSLNPAAIRSGWVWQFITYPFISMDPWQFLVSLSGIYFLGPSVEGSIGYRRFWSFFLGTVVLSGILGFLLSLTGVIAHGSAFSMIASANAILMVFYLLAPDAPIMAFFILQIPVKWLVLVFVALETAYLLLSHFLLFYCVALAGFGAGYIWYKLFLTRRSTVGISEKYYSFRNSYYRWKRRRAARKFEVYMRDRDRTVTFDEHGNYVPPDDDKKNGGSKSGWVN